MNMMMGFVVEAPQAIAGSQTAPVLQAWLARHQPQLLDFHADTNYFGNIVMVLAKDGLQVRFVVDRGDLLVDVGRDGQWLADTSIDAFMQSVPVSQGRSWPIFDPFADPSIVLHALSDPRLAAFLRAADAEALTAIGVNIAPA